ncbi:MAG: MarR family transcriptional regulator [Christensenellaceae bacterium]|jgi:DNA-binding MarR family transcriptional regulator|nr:MarR family transcriptional regulator [Christensenellaceae bacterium]
MEKLNLAKNILMTRILSQNACEEFNKKANKKSLFQASERVLFLIEQYSSVSPSVLIEKLYIAKSNLAPICKQLLNEELIKVRQDTIDKRIIYYSLTEKGKEHLKARLEAIGNSVIECCPEGAEELNRNLEEINQVLSKKF